MTALVSFVKQDPIYRAKGDIQLYQIFKDKGLQQQTHEKLTKEYGGKVFYISLLSNIGFSLDSIRRDQALAGLFIGCRKRSKPPILHAGQVYLSLPKRGYRPPRFWTALLG
jgi:hypothetical protein